MEYSYSSNTPRKSATRPEALCLTVPISGGEGDRVFRMDEVSERLLSARIGVSLGR